MNAERPPPAMQSPRLSSSRTRRPLRSPQESPGAPTRQCGSPRLRADLAALPGAAVPADGGGEYRPSLRGQPARRPRHQAFESMRRAGRAAGPGQARAPRATVDGRRAAGLAEGVRPAARRHPLRPVSQRGDRARAGHRTARRTVTRGEDKALRSGHDGPSVTQDDASTRPQEGRRRDVLRSGRRGYPFLIVPHAAPQDRARVRNAHRQRMSFGVITSGDTTGSPEVITNEDR